MLLTGSGLVDADRAFVKASRERRRAALLRLLRRSGGGAEGAHLCVVDDSRLTRSAATPGRGVRTIPVESITATLEPSRASLFDAAFRPTARARCRWTTLWLAEQRGAVLPPISVFPVDDGYAVRDGHHRVSVARARGALAIDADVDAGAVRRAA